MIEAYRQGDVVIVCVAAIPQTAAETLDRPVVLAYGEATGHRHQFVRDEVRYFLDVGTQRRFLSVEGPTALLTHEEHGAIALPRGSYEIHIQREYEPDGWRNVTD